jgi:opacity protein-like surface antigen
MKTFSLVASRLLLLVSAVSGSSAVLADPDMFAPERNGRAYWYLGAGAYRPDINAQLSNQQGKFGLVAGAGYRASAQLAWELDLFEGYQKLDTPTSISPGLFGTVDAQASLSTMGIAATARYIYPLGRLEPYAGGGAGLYEIRLRASGQQLGLPAEFVMRSTELGWHVLAGADYYVGSTIALGVEFRLRKVSANFDGVVPGQVEAGGRFVTLMLRGTM